MNNKLRFRRTTILSFGLAAFLLGLVLARWQLWYLEFAWVLAALPLLALIRKRTVLAALALIVIGLAIGIWRGGVVQESVAEYRQLYGQKAEVNGRVLDDPVYDDKGRLDFRVGSIDVDGQPMPGQVRIKSHVSGTRRGDRVRVSGTLMDGFGNYQATIYFGTVEIKGRSSNPIEKLRREFFAAVYSVLPEPQGSLGLGFLVGLRSALPEEFDDQLQVAGLTHIVVASGYNLTILVRLSRRILARYSKYQAFVGSLVLILAFLAITGASPSMVRASVVTVLSLLAWYYGRRFKPVLIILLGAALTAGFNPLFIWHDLGWWLSFLAFAGVLILAPLVSARFYGEKTPPLLVQVAIETMAAQALATPLILFTFGELSLVALFANIAVVPLIPFAMAGTFVAGAAGLLLSGGFAGWFALPAQFILSYIVSVTRFFASLPWAQREVSISSYGMAALYVLVLGVVVLLYAKSKTAFDKMPSIVE